MASDGDLRKVFRKHLPRFDWQSIETGAIGDGVPDMNYCARFGLEGWLENKQCEHWRVGIRPAQVGWIERRLRYNNRVFIAVRRARDELWFFQGKAIRALVENRIDAVPCLGHWGGGPAKWDWKSVEEWMCVG